MKQLRIFIVTFSMLVGSLALATIAAPTVDAAPASHDHHKDSKYYKPHHVNVGSCNAGGTSGNDNYSDNSGNVDCSGYSSSSDGSHPSGSINVGSCNAGGTNGYSNYSDNSGNVDCSGGSNPRGSGSINVGSCNARGTNGDDNHNSNSGNVSC